MDLTDKKRIKQYLSSPSDLDSDFVASSFLKDENDKDLKEIAHENWEGSPTSFVDLQHILNKVHFRINEGKPHEKHLAITGFFRLYYKVAAILLFPLIVAGIYLLKPQPDTIAEITAPQGSRVQFVLPDGSKGFLNGGSTIKYKTRFVKDREVTLEGEGYFEVTKDKKHPFTVETEFADIQVLGTRFDVCAYKNDNEITTTLEEGKVSIFNKATKTRTSLIPGEQNRIKVKTGEMANSKVETELYTSWKEDMLRFDNAPFSEVVKKMERWYGVKIILDKKLEYEDNYTLTLKTESLKETLQLLSITTPMNYKINADTVFINQPKKGL